MPEPPADSNAKGPDLPAVAAAVGALVAGVGALTVTGELGRVQRNAGAWFAVAVMLVALGAGVVVIGSLIHKTARSVRVRRFEIGLREGVQGLGVVLSLLGLAVGHVAAIGTASDTEQPAVGLKVDDVGRFVTAQAKVANLSSEDRLVVYVDGLDREEGANRPINLYQAFVGPNGEGNAVSDIRVALPPGRFDAVGIRAYTALEDQGCGDYPLVRRRASDATGCAIAELPSPGRPQVQAAWQGRGRTADSLKVSLDASRLPAGPTDDLVLLQVSGVGKGKPVSLYRAVVAPSSAEPLKRTLRVPVPSGMRAVCTQASTIARGATLPPAGCPSDHHATDGTVYLRVPRAN